MEKRTTIQLEHKTLEKLKKFRIAKHETYDEILNRMFPVYEEFQSHDHA